MGRRSLVWLASLALSAAVSGCLAAPPDGATASPENIVDGTLDNGDPAVYLLVGSGYTCTAELISPHVVLTARHCVVNMTTDAAASPSTFTVFVGRDFRTISNRYRVRAVRIIPGSTGNIQFGGPVDLGLLILSTAANETPYTVSRADPVSLIDHDITAIGFGQTPGSMNAGTKYRTTGHVTQVIDGRIYVDPTVCEGDSGGPAIGADGSVWGVASFITSADGVNPPVCGTAPGAYNALYPHLDWIDSVLEEAGDICIPRTEVCDGIDNDCNGVADEGCLAVGEACTDAARCTSGHCEATAAGMICTTVCDPTRPAMGCEDGFRCVDDGSCSGFCVPGAPGTLGVGIDCTDDASCSSGACVDPGDGRRRCLAPCFGDVGQCASGEVCTAADGGCGACVPSAIFGSPHGLGEECNDDAGCRSGHCLLREGIHECVTPCTGTMCPDGFVCEGENCVLDRAQPAGGICADTLDCAVGICAHAGMRGWCTPADCTSTPCPNGTACADVGGGNFICTPNLALPGEACTSDAGCGSGACFDGQCVTVCTEANDCGVGTRCIRTEDGTSGRCLRPGTPSSGSCGCAAAGTGAGRSGVWVGVLALALFAARRRRAR